MIESVEIRRAANGFISAVTEIPLVKNWKEIYEIVTGTVDI